MRQRSDRMEHQAVNQSKFIYWASGIVSICGIVFEVLFGALGSYILGDGVKQYTLTISLFLTGMGIGASVSEKVLKQLVIAFVYIEFSVALIGGFSSFTMFGITAYSPAGSDAIFLYVITFLVGALTGVELPILIRKANELGVSLNRSTARVLFSDYAGGLIGGLLFVFFLRPYLGMVKTAFFGGFINISVALVVLWLFRKEMKKLSLHFTIGLTIAILLFLGFLFGEEAAFSFEQKLYKDPIIHMEESKYQKIILTEEEGDVRLYLDGQLQLSSIDEFRYHELLVHPTFAQAEEHKRVLILGGGDGVAAKEALKYKEVESITLVDLDPAVVELAKHNRWLTSLNQGSLENEKVHVVHMDAFEYLEKSKERFDVILVDLPDPNNESLNKLYTKEFYSLVRNHTKAGGAFMVQATSPVFATDVYWTITNTIASTGVHTENFHTDVPSFGNWGFVLGSRNPIEVERLAVDVETRYLKTEMLKGLTYFGKDEDAEIMNEQGEPLELAVNSLIDPILIQLYENAWKYY
ncbi:polyamine aminopropyltransferase [Radiobacillus deserti]|uniref:Polyamine aminopropyltransferase n=1 Tax=Radiobacillus deserti TaxID=2594883 RepID=A0A516KHJ4_9BACI|nr:polyamine aminopropyltransferase [Radiobacillus deserti]QDP40855.1 polyamine aminopropyltransferase [Radiobacillus deserti]